MSHYTLKRTQVVNMSLKEAWEFFSSPANLKKITPPHMGFNITSDLGDGKMYSGMIISYIVKPVLGIPLTWVTEIKNVEHEKYFVDEQRKGPYALWHHQHHFREVEGGIEITDIVNYILPFGILGNIAHTLFVRQQLEEIFDYRKAVIEKLFPRKKTTPQQVAAGLN